MSEDKKKIYTYFSVFIISNISVLLISIFFELTFTDILLIMGIEVISSAILFFLLVRLFKRIEEVQFLAFITIFCFIEFLILIGAGRLLDVLPINYNLRYIRSPISGDIFAQNPVIVTLLLHALLLGAAAGISFLILFIKSKVKEGKTYYYKADEV